MSVCLVKTTNQKVLIQHCDSTNTSVSEFILNQNTDFLHLSNCMVCGSVDTIDVDVVQIKNSTFTECPEHAISISGASEEVLIHGNRFRSINNNETIRTSIICFNSSATVSSMQANNNSVTKGALATYKPDYFLYLASGGTVTEKQFRSNSISSSSYNIAVSNMVESLTVVYGDAKIQGDLEVTGHITLGLAPTNDNHATTKKYVDDRDATYTHEQTVADTTWIINHNLNKKPSVTIEGPDGEDIYGEIAYPSLNMTTITFTSAETGTVYLN